MFDKRTSWVQIYDKDAFTVYTYTVHTKLFVHCLPLWPLYKFSFFSKEMRVSRQSLTRFTFFCKSSDWIQSNFNYKYVLCQQKLNLIYSNVIICFILTPFLTLLSQTLLPSPLKLQNFTTPSESLMSMCGVFVQIWHLFPIHDRKYRIEIIFFVFN